MQKQLPIRTGGLLSDGKAWFESLTMQGNIGIMATVLGWLGFAISTKDLNYLWYAIPTLFVGIGGIWARIYAWANTLGTSGILRIVVGVLTGAVEFTFSGVFGADLGTAIASHWEIALGVFTILMTIVQAKGLDRAIVPIQN